MKLANKVALVTGATGGIGFAIAHEFCRQGCHVILNGIDEAKGAERLQTLRSEGYEAEFMPFDVTDEKQVNASVRRIGERHGKIDIVVNNAGGLGGRCRFEEMPTAFFRKVMALNLDSAFFVSRAAIPYLKQGDHPTIINFTSNAAWNAGGPGAGVYGTSKAGVHALTRALAKDLAEYGIRVNAVSPGTIDTPFHQQIKSTKPEVFASWANNIMLGRLGQPQDVAGMVAFLAGNDAAFITAETIQIGGGQALGI